jgi:hypothetical protein
LRFIDTVGTIFDRSVVACGMNGLAYSV